MSVSINQSKRFLAIGRLSLFFMSILFSGCLLAQSVSLSGIYVDIDVTDKPFREVLSSVESQIPLKFAYSTDLIQEQKNVSITAKHMLLGDFLTTLLQGTSLTYRIIGNQIVLQHLLAPPRITLSGYVKDSLSGELLIGATFYLPESNTGTLSNNYGFYSVSIEPADSVEVEVSYVGYKPKTKRISAHEKKVLSFNLDRSEEQESMGRLTIANDKREDNVKKNQVALIELSSHMLNAAPSLSGDGDVLNSVQMLPGIQAGMDGMPGYSVRGGNTGQNLVLLDEATLYNPSHLFGLMGIFNASAVKSASLLKGGFPASYGDHISSVLDVTMKDGNKKQYGGEVQLSPITSGITLYGPLRKEKSSFLLAARRSAIDLFLRPFSVNNYFSNYYFYDINAKLNFRPSSRDRLFLSFYKGLDKNNYTAPSTDDNAIDYGMHFGNLAFAMRWNHLFSGKLFSNTSIIYNRYHQFLSATQDEYFAQLYSGIRDINLKTDFSFYPSPAHTVKAGFSYLYQTLFPASVSAQSASEDSLTINPGKIPEKNASRVAAYASDDIKLGDRFSLYAGVRVPLYYRSDVQYLAIEPRFSLLYLVTPTTSIKASYTQMHQYTHLVQSYNAAFPAEIWIGSSPLVRPETSQEVSAGLFKNFKNNEYQVSLEYYYKLMDQQLLFKGSTAPVIDNNLEDKIIFGKGWSNGAEFLARKNRGKLIGWLAYSLAWSYQQFDSLNLGKSFPSAFDRRHSLYLAATYELSPHWHVSADFRMATGRAITLTSKSDSSLSSQQNSNPLYDNEDDNGDTQTSTLIAENNYRLTPYNRLDLAISYKKLRKMQQRTIETEWTFSVYNAYARNNGSFAYRAIDPATKEPVIKEVSFLPIIPSITFRCRF